MNKIYLLIALSLFANAAIAQKPNPQYDSTLAKQLKGNDMGMKRYVLVILKSGSVTNATKATTDSLFTGHMKNINRLADEGKLIVAGPLGKNDKTYRGIFIMNVESVDEAKQLVLTDPAVAGNLLDAEYFPFFGSAALQETLRIHKKVQKYN